MKRIKTARHRKVPFSFTGKGGIMLCSGLLMALILAVTDHDPARGRFDRDAQVPSTLPDTLHCTLEHIADGDTVTAQCAGYSLRIRLMGIDTPEMGQRPWGERSKQALAALLPRSFTVRTHGQDVYQRTLGTLFADGQDLNLSMVEAGMAVAYHGKETPSSYYAAEKRAKAKKLGIWATSGDQQNPRQWRRYHQ